MCEPYSKNLSRGRSQALWAIYFLMLFLGMIIYKVYEITLYNIWEKIRNDIYTR